MAYGLKATTLGFKEHRLQDSSSTSFYSNRQKRAAKSGCSQEGVRQLGSTRSPCRRGATHRVVLQFLVVHVDDVGADAVQEVLGMRDEHQDTLKTAEPKSQSGRRSKPGPVHSS